MTLDVVHLIMIICYREKRTWQYSIGLNFEQQKILGKHSKYKFMLIIGWLVVHSLLFHVKHGCDSLSWYTLMGEIVVIIVEAAAAAAPEGRKVHFGLSLEAITEVTST